MPTRLQVAFRTNDTNLPRAVEMLRLLRAAPIGADAVVLIWDGESVVFGLSLDGQQSSEWAADDSQVAEVLRSAFEDAGIHVNRVDPLPPAVASHFTALGGSPVN